MVIQKRSHRAHAQIRLMRKRIKRIDRFFVRALRRLSNTYYACACAMLLAYGTALFMLTPIAMTLWYAIGALVGAIIILIATAWSLQTQLTTVYHRWSAATSAPVVIQEKKRLFTPINLDQRHTVRKQTRL